MHAGDQHGFGTAAGEDAVGDDARPLVDGLFQRDGVADLQARDVENGVAVVGDVAGTFADGTTQFLELATDQMHGHGHDLDRQRELAQHRDVLGFVDDADEVA